MTVSTWGSKLTLSSRPAEYSLVNTRRRRQPSMVLSHTAVSALTLRVSLLSSMFSIVKR